MNNPEYKLVFYTYLSIFFNYYYYFYLPFKSFCVIIHGFPPVCAIDMYILLMYVFIYICEFNH